MDQLVSDGGTAKISSSSNVTFDLRPRTLQSWQRPEPVCISNCNCYTASVSPVCGSNGVTYLSACFAGCTKPVSAAAGSVQAACRPLMIQELQQDHRRLNVLACLSMLPEPEQLCVYLQRQRGGCDCGGGGSARKMSQSRLPGGLPHLPVCYLCVQHDRSHGPDSLRHHPHQASTPAAQQRELSALLVRDSVPFCWTNL